MLGREAIKRSPFERVVIPALLLLGRLFFLGCDSDDATEKPGPATASSDGGGAETGSNASCPAVMTGGNCPTGCNPGFGQRPEVDAGCRIEEAPIIVTCTAPSRQNSDAVCVIRTDGEVFFASSSLLEDKTTFKPCPSEHCR